MFKRQFFTLFICIICTSCGPSNKFNTDVSGITYKPTIYHWDDRVFEKPLIDPLPVIHKMKIESPALFAYLLELLHISNNDTLMQLAIIDYANNGYMKESYVEVKKVHKSTQEIENKLGDGFKRVKQHFPNSPVPSKIIFMHTAFGFNVLADSNAVGVSLELYLGANNSVTQKLPARDFPNYIKTRMDAKYICVDVFKTWTELFIIPELKPSSLLDKLIEQGKIMYVMDALMPTTPDHIKIRYTEKQFAWCVEFEKDIWKEIIDNKWLYTTDEKTIAQFFSEGPFTPSLPQNSPSRAGVWMGWKMVREYMEANTDVTIRDLVKENDTKKILSYYKPN